MPRHEEDDLIELNLTQLAVQAAYWVMTSTDCKHRSEARLVRKVLKAIKREAMNMTDEIMGTFKGGRVVLPYDAMKHLLKCAEKKFEGKGVDGLYVEGVDELLDTLDDAELGKKVAARAKQENKQEDTEPAS